VSVPSSPSTLKEDLQRAEVIKRLSSVLAEISARRGRLKSAQHAAPLRLQANTTADLATPGSGNEVEGYEQQFRNIEL
jgi:hypothetical protein